MNSYSKLTLMLLGFFLPIFTFAVLDVLANVVAYWAIPIIWLAIYFFIKNTEKDLVLSKEERREEKLELREDQEYAAEDILRKAKIDAKVAYEHASVEQAARERSIELDRYEVHTDIDQSIADVRRTVSEGVKAELTGRGDGLAKGTTIVSKTNISRKK